MKPISLPHRIHGLDTLRALAIVLVFANHHLLFVSKASPFGWLGDIGWIGVDLFFGLSGYLIGNQIFAAMRSEQGFSLPVFYARRFLRTLPNFYVVLALYALWPWFRNGLSMPPLWEFVTFTQNIHLTPGTAFSHAWSLCVEEQFYVLLPAVALLVGLAIRPLALAWPAIAAALVAGAFIRSSLWTQDMAQQGGYAFYTQIYYASWCRFDELVAGVALALIKNYHGRWWTRLASHGNAAFAVGAGLLIVAGRMFYEDHFAYGVTVLGYPLLALAVFLLLVAALSPGSLLARTRIPGAQSLALWSYAIYLLHKQLCILLKPALQDIGLAPQSPASTAVMAAVSLAAGWLLYAAVETPFMKLRERWFPGYGRISMTSNGACVSSARNASSALTR
ncbi:acyltransferase [Pseudoduganella ginsengisoli]|uniref:Acyltransferase family protein n=1 Tax=Pseudoduganella ginsengisoli TaxID=1462440 RepID=A0A6L6Q3J3_9BURK|nr:acyltransferase [Pseudoduganella ginsengisoli]MTW03861.1 acyltransferase family protein [Pseudoduganella ginsengisoli]